MVNTLFFFLDLQAGESLEKIVRPIAKPVKVKVMPGSFGKLPVDQEVKLNLAEISQRRDYANYILNERLNKVDIRHKHETKNLYLPYVTNKS